MNEPPDRWRWLGKALASGGMSLITPERFPHYEQVGWLLCKDGSFWPIDNPDHAGRCPDCTPVYKKVW